MNHIKIEQNSDIEVVNNDIIHQLVVEAEDCDSNSVMTGNLRTTTAYEDDVDFLTSKFSGLTINATQGLYVRIDSAVSQIVADNIGDGTGVTSAQLALVTKIPIVNGNPIFKENSDWVDGSFVRKMSLTELNDHEFRSCTSLKTLGNNPFANVTKLGMAAFYHCENLEGELNFPSLTYFNANGGAATFCSCSKITKVVFGHPTQVSGHGYSQADRDIFDKCSSLRTVDFGDSITIYGNSVFRDTPSMECIVFRTTTPPTMYGDVLHCFGGNNTCKVFVPDNALSTY